MAKRVIDFVWETLNDRLDAQQRQINENQTSANVAGLAYSFATYTVDNLPLAVDGQTAFAVAYASDGRKSGESAGDGTGLPVWYDVDSDKWLTFYDNSEVEA